jgi:hypothetical protein
VPVYRSSPVTTEYLADRFVRLKIIKDDIHFFPSKISQYFFNQQSTVLT